MDFENQSSTADQAPLAKSVARSTHTPGPWSVPHFATAKDESDCDCTYVLAEGYFGAVCSVHIDNGKAICDGGNDAPPVEEAKANARLIAAAPDLLAALQAMLERYTALVNSGDAGNWDPEIEDAVVDARAAIKKARNQ
jgi:hypothetical protein